MIKRTKKLKKNPSKKKILLSKFNIKYIVSLSIVLIGILSLISGTSYAILKGNTSDTKEQVIKTGKIELTLTESYDNINKKITVMSDEDGLMQEETYDFNIKNTGDAPAKYDLKLINEVPSTYTGKVLDTKYVKIGLEINGTEYGPMSLEKVKNIIDSDIIYKKEMINFKMRIWLDKTKEKDIENLEDYKAFLKLKIEAVQRPESMDTKDTTKTFNYTGDVQEYTVPRDGYYYIEMAGAGGGSAQYSTYLSEGYGGFTSGYTYLEANEKLYFYVGGKGSSHSGTTKDTVKDNGKGYNGGSIGNFYASNSNAGGGGGATDVRLKKASTQKYRYVRSYISGSNKNTGNHWVELEVFDKSHKILSKGKTITHNGTSLTYSGNATSTAALTDGNIATANYVEVKGVTDAYIEMDLGAEYDIGEVFVWHYYGDSRTYKKNKIVLLDSTKTKQNTVFNSDVDGEYAETEFGKQVNADDKESLISRIMVAGGGGGADSHTSYPDYSGDGGNGGTLYGEMAQKMTNACYKYGESGTQTYGGYSIKCSSSYATINSGYFGRGGTNNHSGGGGGYYGGGSGQHTSAGGGSSYISGYAGVNSVKESTTITHNNQTIHYSGKYFVGGKMLSGTNENNGYAKISYVDTKPKRKNIKLNNVRYIKDCHNINSSSMNRNYWAEIQAIKDGVNIAKGKTITGSVSAATGYEYSNVLDGKIDTYAATGTQNPGNTCVTVDLGKTYDLDEIMIMHDNNPHSNSWVFYDNKTYVSSDNTNFTTLINDINYQTSTGKRVNAYTDYYNGYIQDNLKLWYDGYNNTGTAKSYTTSTWKDLSGSGYDGTITNYSSKAVWADTNLQTTDSVVSTISAATLLPPTSDRTLSITFFLTKYPPYTNTTYGNTGVLIGAARYSGMAIYWRSTSAKSYYIVGGTRTASELIEDDNKFDTYNSIAKRINLTYVNDSTNGKVINYIDGVKVNETKSVTGSYQYTSEMGNFGLNKAQIYSSSSPASSLNIGIYNAKVYTKALTPEEVKHNYLYDAQQYGIK